MAILNAHDKSLRDVIERTVFVLLLVSTLLTRVKMPYTKYGIHNLLIPLFALMLIVLRSAVIKEAIIYHRRTLYFMGLLYMWMWISAFQSEFQSTAIKFSIKYSYYPLLYTAFLFLSIKNNKMHHYNRLIIYFLLLLGIFGIVEEIYPASSIFHLVRPFGSFMPRVSSLMQNPNPLGTVMSLGVIMSILLRKDKTICRTEFIVSIVIFTIGAVLSGSRNAVFVLLVGFIILVAYREIKFTKHPLKWLIFISGAIVLFLFYIYSGNRISYVVNHYLHGEGSYRFLIWNRALYEIIHNPISGIGMEVFSKHIGTEVLGGESYHTHNIFLNILVELGAVGLILSVLLIYNLLKDINYKDPRITMPIIMIFASQIFDYYFHDVTYAAISFYFLSLAANSENEHYQKPHLAV